MHTEQIFDFKHDLLYNSDTYLCRPRCQMISAPLVYQFLKLYIMCQRLSYCQGYTSALSHVQYDRIVNNKYYSYSKYIKY